MFIADQWRSHAVEMLHLAAEARKFAEQELAVDIKMSQLLSSYRKAVNPAATAA